MIDKILEKLSKLIKKIRQKRNDTRFLCEIYIDKDTMKNIVENKEEEFDINFINLINSAINLDDEQYQEYLDDKFVDINLILIDIIRESSDLFLSDCINNKE